MAIVSNLRNKNDITLLSNMGYTCIMTFNHHVSMIMDKLHNKFQDHSFIEIVTSEKS